MRVVRVLIDVTVFARRNDNADFDGWVGAFHLVVVTVKATGITPTVIDSVIKVGVPISFPRAVIFIADFPIFETEVIGDVGMADPVGGFAWSAGAIIDGDERLDADNWVRHSNVTNHFGFKYWEVGNENYGTWERDWNTNLAYRVNDG